MKVLKQIARISVLGLAAIVGACDSASMGAAEMDPSPIVALSTTGDTYTIAQEADPEAGSISAEIGSSGGELTLGANTLLVAPGAVSKVTTFTITRDPESSLRVDLTATWKHPNDVGVSGFDAPVTLQVGYHRANQLPKDVSSLTLLYFRPDGLVEALPTVVDADEKTISADLPHFSAYGLGWP